MSASASFAIDAVICGYHVYKEFGLTPWTTCERKVGNSHDPLAVAVKKLIMDCSSAATKVNDLIAIDDIVCSPPKKRRKAYDDHNG